MWTTPIDSWMSNQICTKQNLIIACSAFRHDKKREVSPQGVEVNTSTFRFTPASSVLVCTTTHIACPWKGDLVWNAKFRTMIVVCVSGHFTCVPIKTLNCCVVRLLNCQFENAFASLTRPRQIIYTQ